jgi:hypothetical protein
MNAGAAVRRSQSTRLAPYTIMEVAKNRATQSQRHLQYEARQKRTRRAEEVEGLVSRVARLR